MKITIRFRDGRVKTYTVRVEHGMTVEDIADEVAEQMLEEFMHAGLEVREPERWKEANKRWLAAHLYEALLDKVM